tara:strand:- start:113 stop:472 length:360 start_codon:yes stop_codon:yes gene_type:complete
MSISNTIAELKNLNAEIKHRAKALRELRKKKRDLEATILKFLNNNNQTGVKYRNELAIMKEVKKKCNRKYQKPSNRHAAATELLKKYGIQNSSELATEIINAMRGPKEESEVLKIKTIK